MTLRLNKEVGLTRLVREQDSTLPREIPVLGLIDYILVIPVDVRWSDGRSRCLGSPVVL